MDTSPFDSPSFLLSHLGTSLWTSIAFFVAISAAFTTIVRAKLVLLSRKPTPSAPAAFSCDDEDELSDVSEDEDSDEVNHDDHDNEFDAAYEDDRDTGSRSSGPDIALGGAVVKTWEGIGVRAGLDRFGGGLISLLDINREVTLRSFVSGANQVPEVAGFASPDVVLSAGASTVKAWDARAAGKGTPVAAAECLWRPVRQRKVVRIAGAGDGRVYVRDDAGGVAVADLRSSRRSRWVEFNVVDGGQIADAAVHAALCRLPF
ncbi:hypothetical protein Cni_G01715 [Canna indica]|uniref:Uncharacterized protein n=1 Tax=Canna indica TaxID=4628 RepID=A0AAQ3PZ29_9LILI|nr:hypothetical protein Cni_G01715 [Canna indica]